LGQRLGIQGTPTLLRADGRILPGAAPKERIEQWLRRRHDEGQTLFRLSRSCSALARLCRPDDRPGRAGGLFLQGAGRYFLRLAFWRLCQCRAEQSAGATSAVKPGNALNAQARIDAMAPRSGDPLRSAQKVRRVWLAPLGR
jgi:hypothetical protein